MKKVLDNKIYKRKGHGQCKDHRQLWTFLCQKSIEIRVGWTKDYVRVDKTTKVEKNIPERRTITDKVQAWKLVRQKWWVCRFSRANMVKEVSTRWEMSSKRRVGIRSWRPYKEESRSWETCRNSAIDPEEISVVVTDSLTRILAPW